MKKSIILILVALMLVSSMNVLGIFGGGGGPPSICLNPYIMWPVGLLGRCPSAGSFPGCCYNTGTCGVSIGGTCIPDIDVNDDPSYTYVVQYAAGDALNDGECASEGPTLSCQPTGCERDFSGEAVECYDGTRHTYLVGKGAYCTSFARATANAGTDGTNLGSIEELEITDECLSFRGSSRKEPEDCLVCKFIVNPFPPPSELPTCIDLVCKGSWECTNKVDFPCIGDPVPVTATPATCNDGHRNTHDGSTETGIDGGGPCCGDGSCKGGETFANCAADCGPTCGDALCESAKGEDAINCGTDCPAVCGDGACTHAEDEVSCAADCTYVCGDGMCEDLKGETAYECEADCPEVCGDGACTHTEDEVSCAADCLTVCPDAVCEEMKGETCENCEDDCGVCPILCIIQEVMWTDLQVPNLADIAKGLPVYPLLIGTDCVDTLVDFEIKKVSDDSVVSTEPGLVFEADPETDLNYAIHTVDTTGLDADEYYFEATVHKDGGDEVYPSGILTVINQCFLTGEDIPTDCPDWYLDQDPPYNDPALNADCDDIPDCHDDWVYGESETPPIEPIKQKVTGCLSQWNCAKSPWSECHEEDGEYISTRVVRDCAKYNNQEPCCDFEGAPPCIAPSSKKLCVAEEEFPVFSWLNVVIVLMLLISFYFYKFRKGF